MTGADAALAKIREALASPGVALRLVDTFGHGTAVQVYVKSRKMSPLLYPPEGGSLSDTLKMLGELAQEVGR